LVSEGNKRIKKRRIVRRFLLQFHFAIQNDGKKYNCRLSANWNNQTQLYLEHAESTRAQTGFHFSHQNYPILP